MSRVPIESSRRGTESDLPVLFSVSRSPFTYSYSIIYLHRTDPSVYKLSIPAMTGVFGFVLPLPALSFVFPRLTRPRPFFLPQTPPSLLLHLRYCQLSKVELPNGSSFYPPFLARGDPLIFRLLERRLSSLQELQNEFVPRDAFPQLPWRRVKNPKYIETKHGNKLLISGWWG